MRKDKTKIEYHYRSETSIISAINMSNAVPRHSSRHWQFTSKAAGITGKFTIIDTCTADTHPVLATIMILKRKPESPLQPTTVQWAFSKQQWVVPTLFHFWSWAFCLAHFPKFAEATPTYEIAREARRLWKYSPRERQVSIDGQKSLRFICFNSVTWVKGVRIASANFPIRS